MPTTKDFPVGPLSGVFDSRTPDGEFPPNAYRIVLNMSMVDQQRRARMGGWQKFGADSPFGFRNHDLHDQMLGCLTHRDFRVDEVTDYYGNTYDYTTCIGAELKWPATRETVTLLYEAVSVSKKRKLIAGTKSRLYALNERDGNWSIIGDGLGGVYGIDNEGCAGTRFKTAQLGDFLFFTNNIDPVLWWKIDTGQVEPEDGPAFCREWSVNYVTDLTALGIIRAGVIASWKGFLFVANVLEGGTSLVSQILWSDFNNPLSFIPGGESAAGRVDLGLGERVVAMEPVGGQLRVYTSRGDQKAIYAVSLTGGTEIFNFQEIYRGPDGVEFANSMVNLGNAHYWIGTSGIFQLGEYDRTPNRIEWIHRASGVIDKGIDSTWVKSFAGLNGFGPVNVAECELVCGGYDSVRKSLWFSWPTEGSNCNNMSLCLDLQYGGASLVDHGFTAFTTFRPDYSGTLRDLLVETGVCNAGRLLGPKEGLDWNWVHGGGPAPTVWPPLYYILNETEDPALPSSPYSVCYRWAGRYLDDVCRVCDGDIQFLMASAVDRTIKQFTPGQYLRERFVDTGFAYDCPYTTPGSYVDDGYYSMMQGGSLGYGAGQEKYMSDLMIGFVAEPQTVANLLHVQVAFGQQPGCLRWKDTVPRSLDCLTQKTDEQHEAANTRAGLFASFPCFLAGAWLAWRFWVNGTGGGASFNSVTTKVRLKQGEWR